MGKKPIYHDIEGAPFKVGERVRVVGGVDETFNKRYLGRIGTVQYFEYQCGCGQSEPNDPMIGVSFLDASTEEFWKEELVRFRGRTSPGPR